MNGTRLRGLLLISFLLHACGPVSTELESKKPAHSGPCGPDATPVTLPIDDLSLHPELLPPEPGREGITVGGHATIYQFSGGSYRGRYIVKEPIDAIVTENWSEGSWRVPLQFNGFQSYSLVRDEGTLEGEIAYIGRSILNKNSMEYCYEGTLGHPDFELYSRSVESR